MTRNERGRPSVSDYREMADRFGARLLEWAQNHDSAPLLTTRPLAEAATLLHVQSDHFEQRQDRSELDIHTLFRIGLLHWIRRRLRPDDQREPEVIIMLAMFHLTSDHHPDAVEGLSNSARHHVEFWRARMGSSPPPTGASATRSASRPSTSPVARSSISPTPRTLRQ